MADPVLAGSVLDLSVLPAGTEVHIGWPDHHRSVHLVDAEPLVTLAGPGDYHLGILEPAAGPPNEDGTLAMLPPRALTLTLAKSPAEALAEARIAAKVELTQWIDALADRLQEHAPQVERDSYPQQEAAARAWLAGTATPADTALVNALAARRSRTAQVMAEKIVEKADRFRGLIAAIAGARGAAADAIDASQDEAGMGAAVEAAKTKIIAAVTP